MNEWLKKVFSSIQNLWSKWKTVQKVILVGIVLVVIIAIVATARLSSKPTTVRVFSSQITDQVSLDKILTRIDAEGIEVFNNDGILSVKDNATARRVREFLISENLVPSYIDPFKDVFERSWSTTDADQNIKIKNAIQEQLRLHIESIGDIQMADVNIVLPDDKLFTEDQNPVTASIILKVKPTSNLLNERKRILGIQRLVLTAVEGLKEENLTITDDEGNQINDFEGMAESDKIDIARKQQKLIEDQELRIRAQILKHLQSFYTHDRVRDLVVSVEMDFSEETRNKTEYSAIQKKPDNPDTPYDDSEYLDVLPISQQTVTKEWQGTGFNPEGPTGVEGQTPPVYSDMSNVIGRSTETGLTQNNAVNTEQISTIKKPKIDKISVSVNIDGVWTLVKDEKGNQIVENGSLKRLYTPITEEQRLATERSIQGSINYNRNRGDQVVVTTISVDRAKEHQEEDAEYFAAIQRKRTILMILISVAVVLISFILFRVISRELERRRREREARLLAEQQAARERALWEAKDEGMEVTMSIEETRRMELQENAINMAKEHPEDVALLIRTWLMEE